MYTATKVTIIALALLTAGAVTTQAQNNASINVSAAVQQPVVVLAGNNLTFGNVFPGVPKAIALGSATAGRFDVTAQASAPKPMRAPLTILSPVCAATLALAGQQTGVSGVRPLAFGTVFPGVASVVSRSDPANSGQFDLKGHPGGSASLTFLLPAVMTGPAGATLPLVFGGSDGGFSASQSINNQVAFDPRKPYLASFVGNRASVFLGGTAK